MKKIKNMYILGKAEKELVNIDFIGVWFSPEFATPDRPDYSPAFWQIILRHNQTDAIAQPDGKTYQTEAEAMQALDLFIAELFQA